MLNKVQVSTPMPGVPTLTLDEDGIPEADFIQVRNIDGLAPNKASVSTMPYGLIDGEAFLGTDVPSRHIVLTLGPNPNWSDWTYETLRQFIYSYFMPKNSVKLTFDSDEVGVVEISGVVEDVIANQFVKDPEYIISIVCPNPHFVKVTPVVLTGEANDALIDIVNAGNIETGIYLKLMPLSGAANTIGVRFGDPSITFFDINALVNATHYFDMDSRPLHKIAREIHLVTFVITNRLSEIHEGSAWPVFLPGESQFGVVTDSGVQSWELTYFERYGGI